MTDRPQPSHINDHATRTALIDHSLPDLERILPGSAQAWEKWLKLHGLPGPELIPVNSDIVCDDDRHTVTVQTFVVDEKGHRILDPEHEHVLRETVVVQLSEPALSFPPGFTTLTTTGVHRG